MVELLDLITDVFSVTHDADWPIYNESEPNSDSAKAPSVSRVHLWAAALSALEQSIIPRVEELKKKTTM